MRYFFLICLSICLIGCASKNSIHTNDSDKVLDFGMANSKKITLDYPGTRAKIFVMITYLNPIDHPLVTQESEKFIVGTYMATGEASLPKVALANFEINQLPKEEIKITPLSFDDPLLKLISSANPWSDYLLVEAPKTKEITMVISFESDRSTRVSARFQKDY